MTLNQAIKAVKACINNIPHSEDRNRLVSALNDYKTALEKHVENQTRKQARKELKKAVEVAHTAGFNDAKNQAIRIITR